MTDAARPHNRLTPKQFIIAFGVVSMLADIVYEGARSVSGPFLATFGVRPPPSASSPASAKRRPWSGVSRPDRCRTGRVAIGRYRSQAMP